MADTSTLTLAVDTSGVRRATDDLKAFASQGPASAGAASSVADAAGKMDQAMTASQRSVQAMLRALQAQADTLGKSAVQIAEYKLRMAGATDEQVRMGAILANSAQKQREAVAAAKAHQKAMEEGAAAAKRQADAVAASDAKWAKHYADLQANAYVTQMRNRRLTEGGGGGVPGGPGGGTPGGAAANEVNGVAAAFGRLTTMANLYAAVRVGQMFFEQADSAKTVAAQLGQITHSSQELARAQATVYGISQSTRSSYVENAKLYASMSLATENLGITQQRVAKVVTALNQAYQIQGGTAQEANAATRQFMQAMASGVLRGQEFNSMMEQARPLMQALAQALGVTQGELRKMAHDGKLTADVVISAIESMGGKFQETFDKMPVTTSSAMATVKNAIVTLIGDIDEAFGASSFFNTMLFGFEDLVAKARMIRGLNTGGTQSEGYQSGLASEEARLKREIAAEQRRLERAKNGGPASLYDRIGDLFDADRAFDSFSRKLSATAGVKPDTSSYLGTLEKQLFAVQTEQSRTAPYQSGDDRTIALHTAERAAEKKKQDAFDALVAKYQRKVDPEWVDAEKDFKKQGFEIPPELLAALKAKSKNGHGAGVRDNTASEELKKEVDKIRSEIERENDVYKERQSNLEKAYGRSQILFGDYVAQQESDRKAHLASIEASFDKEKKAIEDRIAFLRAHPDPHNRNEANKLELDLQKVEERRRKAEREIDQDAARNKSDNSYRMYEYSIEAMDQLSRGTSNYIKTVNQLQNELSAGALTQEQFNVLLQRAKSTMEDEGLSQALEQLSKNGGVLRDVYAELNAAQREYDLAMQKLEIYEKKGLSDAAKAEYVARANYKLRTGLAAQESEAWKRMRYEMERSEDPMKRMGALALDTGDEIYKSLGEYTSLALKGKFSEIGRSFQDLIESMLAKAATARLAEALFGKGFQDTGKMGGLLGSLFDGVFGAGAGYSSSLSSISDMSGGTSFTGGDLFSMAAGTQNASGGMLGGRTLSEVNELGPELYTEGGRQYLLTGNQGGTVTRNSQLGGGAGNVVNLTIQGNAQVKSDKQRQGPDGTAIRDLVIEVVSSDIASGGDIAGAMQGTYGLSRWSGARA